MIYWFKRKYRQVKRVLDFLPIIWKGYDWDYKYATDLFAHQLGRMADHFESNRACTLSAGDNAKRIRTTLKLMKLVVMKNMQWNIMIMKMLNITLFP